MMEPLYFLASIFCRNSSITSLIPHSRVDREANTSRETNENGKGGKNGRCYGDGAAMQASPHLLILLGNIGPLLLMNVTGRGEKVEPVRLYTLILFSE
jgi:hypothetical protein